MLLTWVLCMAAASHLSWASALGPQMCRVFNISTHYASSLLDSLQCYTDYSSYVRCSWREDTQTASLPKLSLHHLNLKTNCESPCVPTLEQLSGDPHVIHCQYNTNMFAIGIENAFFFKEVPHSLLLSTTLNLSEHVRVRPPHDLSQTPVAGGGRLLLWRISYSVKGPVYPTLSYQVGYRRLNQEWTVLELSDTKLEIKPGSLVPGCHYEARVRARGGKGPWSEWSSPVEWETEEATLPGPANLQCVSDGEKEVICSWEVTRELAQFVTYSLSYRLHEDTLSEQGCNKSNLGNNPKDPLLKFSCSFNLDSRHGQIWVKLTPTYNVKKFTAHEIVCPPAPSDMQVKEDGDSWELTWTPPNVPLVPLKFQIRYRRTDMQEEERSYNLTQNNPLHRIRAASLLPNTQYEAQVRAFVHSSFYSGSPSEWAKPVRWTTRQAPTSFTTLMYIITAVSALVLFFILFYTLPMCKRRFRLWKVSIPSPLESKVLEGLVKVSLGNRFVVQKELEQADISKVQVLEAVPRSQTWPSLIENRCPPLLLASAGDSGTYKCIAQQGWEMPDRDQELQDKLSKNTCLKALDIPFSFQPSFLAPPGTAALGQLCTEDSSYVPASQALLSPFVSDYVEMPVSKGKLWQENPKEASLQELLDPSSLAYTQAPLP